MVINVYYTILLYAHIYLHSNYRDIALLRVQYLSMSVPDVLSKSRVVSS